MRKRGSLNITNKVKYMPCMASTEEKLKPGGGSNNLLEEMKMLKEMQQNTVPRKHINTELWHACAGPLVTLPQLGSLVYYFPQGHSEQVAVSTNRASTAQIPNYPNLPPQLLCQVHNVTLHADKHTDEIYAQISLQPVNSDKDVVSVPDFGLKPSKHPTDFFFKTLTASDTSTHGGFSVPRRAAEKLFPPLDFSMQPPSQELVVRDLHDNAWNFRHIYRGQPKRHLLTTGWSMFIGAKQLRAGDAVLFVRDEKSQLLVGVRRPNRQQATLPSSVLSADSMHIGILAAAAHAAANQTPFTIFYNPRACSSEFVIPFGRFQKAVFGAQLSVGMRFGMMFETEESNKRRYMGTIHGISNLDPRRWPNSKWRCLQVEWDEPGCSDKRNRVSPWEIETPESLFIFPSLAANFKRPFDSAFMGSQTEWDSLMNMPFLRVPDNSSPGIWSDQLKKMLVKPQDKLASTEFVASAMRSSNGDASLKEVKSLQSAVKHKPDEDVFEPEEGHNSSVVFQGAGNITSFGNNTTDYVQGTPQINQLISPGEGNAEKVAAKQVYPQCFVNDLGATEQNPLLQYPGQANFVSSPATYDSLESFRNPGSLCMVKNHQSPPSDTLYMPQERQELMDSDITGTKSATQTSSLSMLVSQQDISNFPYSSCWQKDRIGEKSNNRDIYGCLNLDVSNCGSTVIGPSLSSALLDDVCGIKNADFHNPSEMLVANFSSNQDIQSQITSVSLADSQAFSMQEYADNSGGTSSSNVDFDNTFLQHGSWNQVATRFRTYTKIQKAGSVGRSIDVSAFKNYDELRSEIETMFGLEGLLNDLGSGWKLVYVDFECDVLLVGDDPWEEFVGCVKCIRILSPSEVKRMGEEGMQLLNTVGMQGIDGAYSTR